MPITPKFVSMTNRKTFIKTTALASAALLLSSFNKKNKSNKTSKKIPPKPMVISTWEHGIKANEAAWQILKSNGKALDAVEAGVRVSEADPEVESVGYGGRPDRDGHVTLDACIMDEKANMGSVACLEHIMHPISVARAVMEKTPHVMLVGEGALQFALAMGHKKQDLLTESSKKQWQEWLKKADYKPVINIENHDTIGMIAMDETGNLSGACTTSGMAYKMHGRVGDSPIIGASLFVDNEIGAATATGAGEEVIRISGTHTIVELMRQGMSPQKACEAAIKRIIKGIELRKQVIGDIQVGFIAMSKSGKTGAYSIHKGFNYAVNNGDGNRLKDADSYFK